MDSLSTGLWQIGETTKLEVTEAGHGQPILFLHPGVGLRGAEPFLKALGRIGRVIAPAHPGFHGSPAGVFTSVDDLSYLYLSLIEQFDEPALVVGASLGGWIALEAIVKSTAKVAGLILVNSVGIRFGTRDTPDLADLYALPRADLDRRMYYDPAIAQIHYPNTPIAELEIIARNREAEARYSWSPYLHNPRLRGRLYRANVPTLVIWGEADTFAPIGYGQQLANALPSALFETIAKAGHFPHIEQASALASRIEHFAGGLRGNEVALRKMQIAL